MLTPSTFTQRLRVIPGSGAGSDTLLPLRRLSLKITSQDLLQFNRRLFRFAHAKSYLIIFENNKIILLN